MSATLQVAIQRFPRRCQSTVRTPDKEYKRTPVQPPALTLCRAGVVSKGKPPRVRCWPATVQLRRQV